ncbi:Putative 37S ribosomal protein S4-like OS=Schizosaccharomyces pombe (strain 972 / ATCC 24843) GN=SPBC13G1,01c PE=2 SV=1 [Rhizoctonia solani AG-1 IB]|uniref:Putative 37S ribosomal protein S4-like n=2 Tax=Thanatephorus cucumeris (strain AG1-IB / isolate 7/3/14) TaxID=1108050 RepID=A0A0B7FBG8_THACB|nr:Putative 37S ribosomal protein S4-like OS=Schizosaccharomyces pombe (strain 972 / ATCC 24843) GN=SPBC13G1,01c PE=2 SV=1 [Rhizoctonia solani AG-1 IB]
MRDANVFNLARSLPRMSWKAVNLWSIWNRSIGPGTAGAKFTKSSKTLFQQRWAAKRFVRAYHGDWIAEKRFQRWFLPSGLPSTRPSTSSKTTEQVETYAGRKGRPQRSATQPTPVTSLMLVEVERRLDVFIFRCCFATSAWQARQLVVHGKVKLNGKKHTNPNVLLNPGDMVSVDPTAIDMLKIVQSPAEGSPKEQVDEAPKNEPESEDQVETAATESTEKPATTSESPSASPSSSSTTKPRSALEDAPKTFIDPETRATVLNQRGTSFSLPAFASPHLFIPAYIEPAFNTCSAVYVRHPTARPGYSEIPSPFGADGEVMRFAWEWYKRHRPRMRSKKNTWINPSGERGNWNMIQ